MPLWLPVAMLALGVGMVAWAVHLEDRAAMAGRLSAAAILVGLTGGILMMSAISGSIALVLFGPL